MSEFDPSRRRMLKKLGATVVGCALAGDGITLLGIWAGRVGEDVAKDLGVIRDEGNPPITVSKDQKTETNTRLFGTGAALSVIGGLILSEPSVSRWQDPKR